MEVRLDIAWRIGRGKVATAAPLLFDLLRAIDEHGSLSRAARSLDVSYRTAWNLLNRWSAELGAKLVIMRRGRGAALSPLGRKLLWAEDYVRGKTATLFTEIAAELSGALDLVDPGPMVEPLTICASHCLTHPLLKQLFQDRTGTELEIKNAGSAKALRSLGDGECQAAGFHLVGGEARQYFLDRFRGCIKPDMSTLIHALSRRQGMIVAPGNPKNIRGVEDFPRPDIRFINRQSHSGTRFLLDVCLRIRGISSGRINGYDDVEFTHSAVSALVASGSADVGLGTEASAALFGLGFIPLATENYYYAVASADIHTPRIDTLVATLASDAFRRGAREYAGYDPANSGTPIPAVEIFS